MASFLWLGGVLTSGLGQNGTIQGLERTQRLVQRMPVRLFPLAQGLMPSTHPEQDLDTRFDRQKVFGECPALQWLVAKHGRR